MAVWVGFLAKSISFFIYHSPLVIQKVLGGMLGVLWFDILRIRRGLVLNNIQTAFPNMTKKDRVRLGRKSCSNLGRVIVEYSYFPFFSKKDLGRFRFEGLEHVDTAKKKGRGVCLLTLHMGSPELAPSALAQSGYPIHLITKEIKTKWLNDAWFAARRRAGTKLIGARKSAGVILKALKANDLVVFVLDQFMGPPLGVKVKFFNKTMGGALGLSVIVSRTKAPVVPVYTYRDQDDIIVIRFEPEIVWEEKNSKDATLAFMTQKFISKLEEVIQICPEQWMWVHKIWKDYEYKGRCLHLKDRWEPVLKELGFKEDSEI